jgi:predicted aspartyl protease/tetratricopeptide (TPR) repeat protein
MLKHRRSRLGTSVIAQSLALLIVFSSAGIVFAAPPKPAVKGKTAREVMTYIIDAYGGNETIKAHREHPMRSHGTISSTSGISDAANSYECDVLEKGDKVRVEMTMLGAPMIIGYDGKNSWQQYGDWVTPASSTTTELLADEMKHGLPALTDALDSKTKLELLPAQTVRGKQCDVIKLTTADGKTTTFYADQTSHLILRADYDGVDHELGMRAAQSIDYEDYRPVAGSKEPYKVVHYSNGRKKTETVIKTIDADVVIDEKAFVMPPESEVVRVKDSPVVIPFEYSGNEIVIKARINGGKEANFIVDTGASQSVIDKATASTLGSHPLSTFSVTAGAKSVPLSYTKLPSLSIGEVTLYDLPVLVTDLSNVADKPAGLIGANILRRFLVTIDYEEKKLTLADPRRVTVPANAATLPTKPVFGGTALIVKGQLDNKSPINFLVDTGASFNNLPQTLAKPIYDGPILTVGVIYGLDGQKMNIGTLKMKTLKLGSLTVPSPVFTVAPDRNPAHAGLFTASAMGILGNPVWSQFKTTIDYRNERLILEPRHVGQEKHAQLISQIQDADREYLKSKNVDEALKAYEKLMVSAQVDQQKAIEAMAIGRMAGCYADKYAKTKETKWLDLSSREHERAAKIANENRLKAVEGQILAQWALMYLNAPRTYADVTTAQQLLTKALQKAPMEPTIYSAFGTTLLRVGKRPEAEKLLDRALVLDPSDWQALWSKYKMYQNDKKQKEMSMVAEQLQHYYPGFPEVVALATTNGVSSKPHVASVEGKAATATTQAAKPIARTKRRH